MNALRKIILLVCTSLLVLFPSVAGDGGEGGWVNVPGGIGFARSAAESSQSRFSQSSGVALQLNLGAGLDGAVAFVRTNTGARAVLMTHAGKFVVPSTVLKSLAGQGVNEFEIVVV